MKKLLLFFVCLMGVAPCFGMDMAESNKSESWISRYLVGPRQKALGSEHIPEQFYLRTAAKGTNYVMNWGNKKSYNGVAEASLVLLSTAAVISFCYGVKYCVSKFWNSTNNKQADNEQKEVTLKTVKDSLKLKFQEKNGLIDEIKNIKELKIFMKNQFLNSDEDIETLTIEEVEKLISPLEESEDFFEDGDSSNSGTKEYEEEGENLESSGKQTDTLMSVDALEKEAKEKAFTEQTGSNGGNGEAEAAEEILKDFDDSTALAEHDRNDEETTEDLEKGIVKLSSSLLTEDNDDDNQSAFSDAGGERLSDIESGIESGEEEEGEEEDNA